jgi:3-hydroxyisobutyrate dehydrogenase-like beta-hydroxyacid dehydrogenase
VLKDMTLGAEVCSEQSFEAPIFETALQAFREVGEAGNMENDLTALFTASNKTRAVHG